MSHFVICKFYLIIIETSLFDFFSPLRFTINSFPEDTFSFLPLKVKQIIHFMGRGLQINSGHFSTIPFTPQVHQIPGGTSLTPSLPGDKYFRRRNQQIWGEREGRSVWLKRAVFTSQGQKERDSCELSSNTPARLQLQRQIHPVSKLQLELI